MQSKEIILNNLVGSARFVWNQMLAISFEMFAKMSLSMPPIWLIKSSI